MVEWLIEPLQYGFFQRGLLAGIIVGISCGILSGFIVWRGMAFIGDALAHAVLPGVVLSLFLGIHMLIGALISAILSVFGIAVLSRKKGFKEDTAIGVIFAGAFALGILLMSKMAGFQDLSHILFGNILGVSRFDVILIAILGCIVLLSVLLFYKELLVTSFDPTHAQAIGLSPSLVHSALLILVAATTVLATQTVGVVLVMALLVTPAAAASLLVRDLSRIILMSTVFSSLSILGGFYLSYHYDLASGATIVLVLTGFFFISFVISKFRK